MIVYAFRLLGIVFLRIEVSHYQIAEDDEDEDPTTVGGGSAHNFERDFFPLSPTSHHEWEWEDKKGFGFG